MKDAFKCDLSVVIPTIVPLPDGLRVEILLVWQHVDGVEDIVSLGHPQIQGFKQEATSVFLWTHQEDYWKRVIPCFQMLDIMHA